LGIHLHINVHHMGLLLVAKSINYTNVIQMLDVKK